MKNCPHHTNLVLKDSLRNTMNDKDEQAAELVKF